MTTLKGTGGPEPSTGTSARLTLYDILYRAGFRGNALKTAWAIALAESGGRAKAYNGKGPDNSYGLFQINMIGSLGPARRKQFGLKSNDDLFDPLVNAKVAFAISNGGKNFKPWSAFTNGAYTRYINQYASKAATLYPSYGAGQSALTGTPAPQSTSSRQSSTVPSGVAGGYQGRTMTAADYIATYGYAQAFYNSVKEIKDLVLKAAREEWSAERFEMEMRDTAWWKARTQAQREYDILSKSDPKNLAGMVEERRQAITRLAEQMGVQLTSAEAANLATLAQRNGYQDNDIQIAVANYYGQKGGFDETAYEARGDAASVQQQIAAEARAYGVPTSQLGSAQWTMRMLAGQSDMNAYRAHLAQQAKQLYPTLASAIDSGMTVKDFVDPYLNVAQQTLGVTSQSMDLLDPKWQRALAFNDGKTTRPMTMDEWQRTLRTDPTYGYQYTQAAKAEAAKLSTALLRRFGVEG